MKYILSFLLCVSSLLAAEQPTPSTQQIVGADKPIPLGELVELSVTSQAAMPDVVAFSTDWSVYDLEQRKEQKFKFFREVGDKTVEGVVFGAGVEPRELIAHCSITYLVLKKEQDKIVEAGTKTELLKVKVIIGTNEPRPPKPEPSPEVKFPNEKLGLSTKVYKAVMERGPPTGRVAGAKAFATSYRGIQSAIAARTIKDPVDALKRVTASNNAALSNAGLKRDDWVQVFTILQDEVFSLYEGNKISTADQLGAAFLEIADAFDAVR